MGRTPKPLRIVAFPPTDSWEEIQALKEQGHVIIRFGTMDAMLVDEAVEADLILGPTCWHMTDAHRPYLKLAIAEARKRRYPNEKVESE